MKTIGIIGAGWLGMDFAKRIIAENNFHVRYTNRTITNENAFAFSFGEKLPIDFSKNLDFLFITSTLPKESKEELASFVTMLKTQIKRSCQLIFTSTIGVYSAENGLINEESSRLKIDSVYFQFEQLLLHHFPNQVTILRLGGLIGENRHPVFSLSGRKNIADGQKAVNLIHKEDILQFFICILDDKVPVGVYNLAFPAHPTKKEYYTEQAIKNGIVVPEFEEGIEEGKIIDSSKSQQICGFAYKAGI